jgi:hypothetical protein
MALVAVLGIPIVENSVTNREVYMAGATDKPRKDLCSMLSKEGVKAIDIGELPVRNYVLSNDDFFGMGETLEKHLNGKGYDSALIIGGSHCGALPLYSLEGNVARIDAHRDSYGRRQSGPAHLNCGTYMWFVPQLKDESQILNIGFSSTLLEDPGYVNGMVGRGITLEDALRSPRKASIIDIDVDALHKRYNLPHNWYASLGMSSKDLARVIKSAEPHVIGLFECIDGQKKIIPKGIISDYPAVFSPICKAVAYVAKIHQASCSG